MSNLSELLPAGSSVKSADFVAQGTLASGVTVGLRSDGKVEAISATGGPPSAGTPVEFETGNIQDQSGGLGSFWAAYDYTNDRVVVSYCDTTDNYYGKAAVGTVSGSAISFGTPVNFNNGTTYDTTTVFSSNQGKIIISYRDAGNSNYGTSIVGTVSGTSISFGTEVVYNSSLTQTSSATWSSQYQRYVISFLSGSKGRYAIASLSGTTLSFGSVIVFYDANIVGGAGTVTINNDDETNTGNILIGYVKDASSGEAVVGQLQSSASYKTLSFGTPVVFNTVANTNYLSGAFESTNKKMVLSFQNGNGPAGTYAKCIVGTVSGTSLSFGSAVVFTTNLIYYTGTTFDSAAGKIIIGYRDATIGGYGRYVRGAVSGTSISFESPVTFSTVAGNTAQITLTYDSDTQQPVVAYGQFGGTNNGAGTAAVLLATSSNVADYVGITDQAISSAATGKVVCKGGVSTGATAQTSPPFLGASSTITSNAYYANSAYDSTTKNTVFQFSDGANSFYGTARVASISGTTLTYGSSVVYSSASTEWGVIAYDSNANKIVIAYRGASNYAYAIVGTVSGTSISFGTAVAINGVNSNTMAISFDSTSNKVVIAYREHSAGTGKAVVGTVSGTSISFGSIVQFAANAQSGSIGLAYDSTNNKTVLLYGNAGSSGNPTAAVGTVSGTSISFGSAVVINGSASAGKASITFDPSSGKVVVAYDQNSQSYVGTVSGTSISFGSVVSYNGGASATYNYLTVDTVTNDVVLFYDNNSTNGRYVYGKVSGTSISWSTPAAVTATRPTYGGISFNVDSKLTIMSYRDASGPGLAVPLSLSTISEPFTIGSNYFVQDDGTISTTSSTTKAGTALSTTSLLLTG